MFQPGRLRGGRLLETRDTMKELECYHWEEWPRMNSWYKAKEPQEGQDGEERREEEKREETWECGEISEELVTVSAINLVTPASNSQLCLFADLGYSSVPVHVGLCHAQHYATIRTVGGLFFYLPACLFFEQRPGNYFCIPSIKKCLLQNKVRPTTSKSMNK